MGRITQPVNIVATIALFSALVLSVYFIMNPFAFNYHKAITNLVEGALGSTSLSKYGKAIATVNNFQVAADVANTEEQQSKGLSVRDKMQENEGMLFVFGGPSKQAFWMKDMKFPIDIIWLDKNGNVVHQELKVQPCVASATCPTYTPDSDSMYVLETVAGFSQTHDIKIGTHIDLRIAS